jgi:diguanylate cyclase (GGDEF)-like protein
LVVDLEPPGQRPADGVAGIPALFDRLGYRIPTIFLAAGTDFQTRLAVARAGGDAFLAKPVAIPALAGCIETLLRERGQAPYEVLIIDDDEVLAEHYRLVLAAAGLLAERVCQPEEVLAAMETLRPDLILMDLHMPSCSGAELARVIRYSEAWQSVPIVYLSAEGDLDQQISALGCGADDFMTKPISDVYLVAAVRARAARARKVTELMSQDSLTNLLKHATIKDRLAQEVDRAQRQNSPLAVVMLDIDHFKQVNDTWGHQMGDQVIKTLGYLLRQRLRRQDSIGRYGGEEFAAVLPDCTAVDALHLIDDIRQRFSEVGFVHQGQGFNITLSAGIATTEVCAGAAGLLAAADAALYAAKRGGRNQVRVFAEQLAP